MRQMNRLAAAAGILAVVTAGHADTILRQRYFDLNRANDPSYFQNYKTQVLGTGVDEEGLTYAQLYLPVQKASLGRTSTSYSEDWSGYNILSVKITNHEAFPIEFKALVYLTSNPSDANGVFSGTLKIAPGESRRFCCFLNPDDAMPYGMEYLRPVLSAPFANVYSSGSFRNLKNIYHWRLSYQGTQPATVDVADLRLIKQDLTFDNMVDEFGQYADREWAHKIHSVSDFAELRAHELTEIADNPNVSDKGSDLIPLAGNPVGKWQVVNSLSGKKYLSHPNGKAFWVLGVSAIHNGAPTPVGGRENYFQSLPSTSGTYASCYYTRPTMDGNNTCYSFHQQNLMLKYGANYMTPWVSHVKARINSWGLNTLGMQCLTPFYDNTMPYTQILNTQNFPVRLKVPYQLWGSFPDPYDATFTSWMTTSFTKELAKWNGQENFLGVYIDNELSWGNTNSTAARRYNLALGALKAPATQPAKVAFVNWLSSRYKNNIGNLNYAWGTNYGSFSSILTTTSYAPSTFTTAQDSDFKGWSRQFGAQYFKSVRAALTASKLSGLYLGCRYADWLPEVVESSDPYVDVHTLNFYKTVPYMNWGYWSGPTLKKPYMFSEMGASVQADGTFGGVGEVYSQQDKADNIYDMLNRAILEKNCVGSILYCYTDQPVTGRYTDYENSGLGLVDVADTPHYEVVDALRAFSKNMYTNRG